MNIENIKTQMRKGILEYCILNILKNNAAYPSEIIAVLKKAEIIVVEGTLYPLLSRLKKAEMLDYHWEESASGPPRKYYKLTEAGEKFRLELETTWKGLEKAVSKTKA